MENSVDDVGAVAVPDVASVSVCSNVVGVAIVFVVADVTLSDVVVVASVVVVLWIDTTCPIVGTDI